MSAPTDEEARKYLSKVHTPEERRVWVNRILGRDDLLSPDLNEVIFFGQEGIKEQIAPFLDRPQGFPNTLILGEPGIGKTQLAKWIANQRNQPFEELLCPVKPEDLPGYGIVLLDESHRQRHPEWLWPVMDNDTVTILSATTRPEILEPAFKSRFFIVLHLGKYSEEALIKFCEYLLPGISEEAAEVYAGASAGNPRQMEKICAVAKEMGMDDPELVLATCRITADGVTEYQIKLLEALRKGNRPLGLSSLATLMYTDEQSVREAERMLIEHDLVELRSNGRSLTRRGKRYLAKVNEE
jgi:Holliday junction resolvasome RuvABC ATP-dependent DNA helicase subunit